jgi:hypothetical protein
MLMAAIEFPRRYVPKLASHIAIPRRECLNGRALEDQDRHVADRLGGRSMLIPSFKAEHVAWKMKRADLTPTVVEVRRRASAH